jgi:GNAT superfamily N-acetyltransferase
MKAIEPNLKRLVAEEQGQIVGTVRYMAEGVDLRLIGLGVRPSFQRKGIARALVEHLERIADAEGARRLSLQVVRETGNVEVFEGMAFHVVAEWPARYSVSVDGRPLTEVRMERRVP